MPFSELPLCSSNQALKALERLHVYRGPVKKGSHQSVYRDIPGGGRRVAVVVLGKREIPKGTLRNILRLLEISPKEFLAALRS